MEEIWKHIASTWEKEIAVFCELFTFPKNLQKNGSFWIDLYKVLIQKNRIFAQIMKFFLQGQPWKMLCSAWLCPTRTTLSHGGIIGRSMHHYALELNAAHYKENIIKTVMFLLSLH